jgi:hypothetical protein
MMTLISTTIRRFAIFLRDVSFWKWISIFGSLGLVIPAIYFFHIIVFATPIAGFNMEKWWPTCIVFMWGDYPNPSHLVIALIVAIAILGNVALYAALGGVTWPILFVARRFFHPNRLISK